MSTSESPPPVPPAPKWLEWLLVAVVPVLCFVVGGIFLPAPKTAAEARKSVDRSALADVVLKERPRPDVEVDAVLGDIRVLGADVPDRPLRPGGRLEIDLYFEALAEMDRNWKVFVHIDREGGTYRIHGDHFPVGGGYHTSLWQRGEYVRDRLTNRVPIDAPSGRYDIWVGFYIGDERMPFRSGDKNVHDGQNRIRVGTLTVR